MGKILSTYKYETIKNLVQELDGNNEVYYVFTSHPTPWANETVPPAAFESVTDSIFDTQRQLLFGKRLHPSNIQYLAQRVDWTSNTTYGQYSDSDINLYEKNFYVITDDNKVFKCLYNNKGAASTTKPTLAQNTAFTTADGYTWKYLYTVSASDMAKFGTSSYMPVTANSDIVASANDGLEVLEVIATGVGYETYNSGTVKSVSNTTLIQIDTTASLDNDFYNSSAMYIDSGPGQGQLSVITDYISNTSGNWCKLEDPMTGVLPVLSTYAIAPQVKIVGDGTGAAAYSEVSEAGGIENVVVISAGSGYTRANVTIVANSSFGSGANVVAYIPPPGGHGSDVISELHVDSYGVFLQFANTEGGTISTDCSYRRYGILKNPEYANGDLYTVNTFSQVWKGTTSPTTVFSADDVIVGQTSGAQGVVLKSNTTTLMMTGDKHFANGETITNSNTGVSTTIASITDDGDINQKSPKILYINNLSPIDRSTSGPAETVRLIIQL